MSDTKYLFAALGVITFFIFLVSGVSIYVQENYSLTKSCGCDIPIYLVLIAFASFGLFAGSMTYYLHSKYTDNEKKHLEKSALKTLDFLETTDKKIVKTLLKEEYVLQSELSKKTKIDSVKLHRRLKNLESKNIVRRERNGMSYKVYLNKELKALFE